MEQKKSILLVEDEVLVGIKEADILKKYNFDVFTSVNAKKAIDTVKKNTVDLVLMDIDLGDPEIDGTQLAEMILKEKDLPIVFLTNHGEKEIVDKVKGITKYGYVIKTTGEFVLIETINAALQLFEAHKKLKEERDRFSALSQTSPIPIVFVDSHGAITYANEQAEKVLELERRTDGNLKYNDPQWEITDFHGNPFLDEELPFSLVQKTKTPVYNIRHLVSLPSGRKRYVSVNASPLFDEDGNFNGMVAVIDDITDRIESEKKIKEFSDFIQVTMDTAGIAWWEMDIATGEVTFNRRKAEILGYGPEQFHHYEDFMELVHPEDYEHVMEAMRAHLDGRREKYDTEYRIAAADGRYKWFRDVGAVTKRGPSREPLQVVGLVFDISGQKQIQEALYESQLQKKVILNSSAEMIVYYKPDLQIIWANQAVAETFRVPAGELVGQHCYKSFYDMREPCEGCPVVKALEEKQPRQGEQESSDGKHWMLRGYPVLDEAGDVKALIEFKQDITRLKKIIKEKEYLMKELNHRVKNNLLMVSSLIGLKDSSLGDEVDLSDLEHQIDAIRLIHENLFQSGDIVHISLREYIRDLLETVFSFYSRSVLLDINVEIDQLLTRTTIPLGLILNELATNAMKHGFTQDAEPRFSVSFEVDNESDDYVLTISNNGKPFPEDVDLHSSDSMGLPLIQALVEQIDGTLLLIRNPFPIFTIRFPHLTRAG